MVRQFFFQSRRQRLLRPRSSPIERGERFCFCFSLNLAASIEPENGLNTCARVVEVGLASATRVVSIPRLGATLRYDQEARGTLFVSTVELDLPAQSATPQVFRGAPAPSKKLAAEAAAAVALQVRAQSSM